MEAAFKHSIRLETRLRWRACCVERRRRRRDGRVGRNRKSHPSFLGHESTQSAPGLDAGRFAYIPLPSVEVRGEASCRRFGGVRRALLTAYSGPFEQEFAWARRNLSGQELCNETTGQAVGLLALIPESDAMIQRYVRPAAEWVTATPVVLPGFDDPAHIRRRLEREHDAVQQKVLLGRLEERIDGLLRKAIVQAGFSAELARDAELEWRMSGFWRAPRWRLAMASRITCGDSPGCMCAFDGGTARQSQQ